MKKGKQKMHVPFNEPGINEIIKVSFPNNRKDIIVEEFKGPVNVDSYWSDGSRDEYCLVDLITFNTWTMPHSHPFFDGKSHEVRELPPNCALVCGGIFRGKPATICVLLHSDNLAKLLPGPIELSDREQQALYCIKSIKGGNYRKDEWNRRGLGTYSANHEIIKTLETKGLVKVNKAGSISITTDGKNACTVRY